MTTIGRLRHPWVLLCVAALAAACFDETAGPGDRLGAAHAEPAGPAVLAAAAATEQARRLGASPERASLLASPFGPVPAAHPDDEPSDPLARTRAGQYLARRAAIEMEARMDGRSVWTGVGCCGDAEIDLAEGFVYAEMAAGNLPPDAPVFVDGTGARHAARLADRLQAAGLTRVFVVRP